MTYRIFDGYTMSYQDIPSNEFVTMKSTDMVDIDGETVYECDILERGNQRGIVEWDEWAKRFMVRVGKVTRHLDDASDWSVVGNAFTDKEIV